MPSGDKTGPLGQGSRTGRKLGYCSGNDSPGFENGVRNGRRFGLGASRGNGRGRGMGRIDNHRGFGRQR